MEYKLVILAKCLPNFALKKLSPKFENYLNDYIIADAITYSDPMMIQYKDTQTEKWRETGHHVTLCLD